MIALFWCAVQLKLARQEIICITPALAPLLQVLHMTCSDDETDTEASNGLENEKVCRVRKMEWRSLELQQIYEKIDQNRRPNDDDVETQSTATKKAATNGSMRSRRKPGSAPRQRRRGSHNPISHIKPPNDLPIDCYSQVWLDRQLGLKKAEIKANPVPILNNAALIQAVNCL